MVMPGPCHTWVVLRIISAGITSICGWFLKEQDHAMWVRYINHDTPGKKLTIKWMMCVSVGTTSRLSSTSSSQGNMPLVAMATTAVASHTTPNAS